MSQVRLTLISSLLTPQCNIMNDDETTCSHSTNTHMDDLMTRLKMKLLETRRECTAKPFVPFNCHAVDTLKINSEKHSFQSIRDVKISYSNRYILVSDLCFLGSNFSMIKVFDLTTSLFLKAIGPYHNGPQFLCVEDRPFLEHSYHVSDALIFSHSFLEGNSHQQQLSKFMQAVHVIHDKSLQIVSFFEGGSSREHVAGMCVNELTGELLVCERNVARVFVGFEHAAEPIEETSTTTSSSDRHWCSII